jgi:hypothetical protein
MEDQEREIWRNKKKHIFILSSAGKPIYTLHGDCDKLAGIMGVLVGLISFVTDNNDTIKSVIAGDHKIVFLLKGPIYLALVAKTNESIEQLNVQLDHMHSQIISVLTISAHKMLTDKANLDLRNLLGGTDRYLTSLAAAMNSQPSFLLNSIHCLRLPATTRNAIGQVLTTERQGSDIFYALLLAKGQLVHIVRPKRHILYPPDLHLLINFVNTNKELKDSDASLTPFCLPLFNNTGFLYLYVSYFNPDIALLLLSSRQDDYPQLTKTKDGIFNALNSTKTMGPLEDSLKQQFFSVQALGIPDLLHFLYKSHTTSQMCAPTIGPPYNSKKQRKRLFALYGQVYSTVHLLQAKPHKVYYHRSESEVVVAWLASGFDLYACFAPLVNKPDAIRGCNMLLKWIKQEESNLFINSSPVW